MREISTEDQTTAKCHEHPSLIHPKVIPKTSILVQHYET